MGIISWFIEFILHLDTKLGELIVQYGAGIYAILFLIIFAETGFVFTPFLPGDSLLFVAGAFAGIGSLNIWLLFLLLIIAAVLGDTVNYWVGNYFGEKVLAKSRFVKKEHLDKTKAFYKKHGAKTIIIARFVPIIRTFAPFVAGVGKMSYPRFLAYNVVGGVAWVGLFVTAGYFFGNIAWVKHNLTLVVLGIILISFVPAVIGYLQHRKEEAAKRMKEKDHAARKGARTK